MMKFWLAFSRVLFSVSKAIPDAAATSMRGAPRPARSGPAASRQFAASSATPTSPTIVVRLAITPSPCRARASPQRWRLIRTKPRNRHRLRGKVWANPWHARSSMIGCGSVGECCAASSAYGLPATTGLIHLRRMPATLQQRWFLAAAVAAILSATLFPISGGDPEPWLGCVLCGERGIADALINVLLFFPLGAALAATGMPWARCLLGGALLSAAVEFAQMYIPGRDPSLGDVLSNTLGAGLGAALMPMARSWQLPA